MRTLYYLSSMLDIGFPLRPIKLLQTTTPSVPKYLSLENCVSLTDTRRGTQKYNLRVDGPR
jgi:hypothetical protein